MSIRTATAARATDETSISLTLNLDGSGIYDIDTGCGFLNHMLELFTRHGRFDLTLSCRGDVQVDYHHTTEDVAIVLGRAFSEALGDRAGIGRYGEATVPMDEALILAAVDICGRASVGYALQIPTEKVGDFDTELVSEFLYGFARALGASVHVHQFAGSNSHHIVEGCFKALARAMRQAVAIDAAFALEIPSTKGTIL
ncbi:MAG: imidazoleglycerol-phosphate dehydratase HisB [Ruthenibacterium sp.]